MQALELVVVGGCCPQTEVGLVAVTGEIALGDQAREIVNRTLESSSAEEKADYGVMKEKIRLDLKRYIQKSTSRRPMIMPIILEI